MNGPASKSPPETAESSPGAPAHDGGRRRILGSLAVVVLACVAAALVREPSSRKSRDREPADLSAAFGLLLDLGPKARDAALREIEGAREDDDRRLLLDLIPKARETWRDAVEAWVAAPESGPSETAPVEPRVLEPTPRVQAPLPEIVVSGTVGMPLKVRIADLGGASRGEVEVAIGSAYWFPESGALAPGETCRVVLLDGVSGRVEDERQVTRIAAAEANALQATIAAIARHVPVQHRPSNVTRRVFAQSLAYEAHGLFREAFDALRAVLHQGYASEEILARLAFAADRLGRRSERDQFIGRLRALRNAPVPR